MPVVTIPSDQVGSGDVVGPASSTDNALVVWNGATGKLVKNSTTTITDIANMQAAITALQAIPVVTKVTPTDGQSIVIGNTTNVYIIAPGSALTTLTVTMPATPTNRQIVRITGAANAVAALTLAANTGHTIVAPLTALAVGSFGSWIFVSADNAWYRIG